jgi:hypothetical protein
LVFHKIGIIGRKCYMFFRQRLEKLELIILRELKARMVFSESEELTFFTVTKGYEGELKSDVWLKGLAEDWLILNDLLFEYRGSLFQIDTLIIAYEKMFLLDVKNFEGDHSIKEDKWYTSSGKPEKNPLHQLERCETLLKQLINELGYKIPVESYLIFINPEFHLYQTTNHPAIIFPSQLTRFLKKLNTKPVELNKRHHQLAQQLVDLNIEESPYTRILKYNYEQLKKGITCANCKTLFLDNTLICKKCGFVEDVDAAVLRSVKEFTLLFPERKITTNEIYEWCGGIVSKKTIRRILIKNLKLMKHGRSTYYLFVTD